MSASGAGRTLLERGRDYVKKIAAVFARRLLAEARERSGYCSQPLLMRRPWSDEDESAQQQEEVVDALLELGHALRQRRHRLGEFDRNEGARSVRRLAVEFVWARYR